MRCEVSKTATPAEIKSAWREKAKQLHPDKAASGDARAFRDALDAYRVLKDPGQRELSRREELGAWPGRGRELLRA